MPYDYSKLLGKIVEEFGTQYRFAEAIGLSEHTTSLKLNGKVGWKQAEIEKACQVLKIDRSEMHDYFFALRVQ